MIWPKASSFIIFVLYNLFYCTIHVASARWQVGSCRPEEGKYPCPNQPECIELSQVCDKHRDCNDGYDESPHLCEKSCAYIECAQGCAQNQYPIFKGVCFCNAGFKISGTNGSECANINECEEEWDICSQHCTDSDGSFQCSCTEGFDLLPDNSTCVPKGPKAKIIFASAGSLKVWDLSTSKITSTIVEENGNPVGVTFDAARGYVYWTDTVNKFEAIYRSKLDGKNMEVILNTGPLLSHAEGIAFDWIAQNIYFTDSNLSHVGVCDTNGRSCNILVNKNIDQPREIVLHPPKGKLYWTDWGVVPSVVSAGMDGSHPVRIVSSNLHWPNGLAIDHGTSRLYWADAHSDTIETSNLEGGDRRIVRTTGLRHPFSMDIFGDTLYWSDWSLQQIQSCNKFTGEDHIIEFAQPREHINGVVIYHPAAQPQNRINHCKNAGCSHICVLTPTRSYLCLCPVGMILQSNKKTCTDDSEKDKIVIPEGSNSDQMHSHLQSIRCNASQFVCVSDQTCISGVWRCDGEKDCHDGSDEKNCPVKPCPNPSDFKCALGRCIPLSWRCDKVVDCPDLDTSDEDDCNFPLCNEDQFTCRRANGYECISQDWVCDGEKDCIDGSDVHENCTMQCSMDEFTCMNHYCIQNRLVCNDRDDCGDNSDEAQCPLLSDIPVEGFNSSSSSSYCASDKYWCLTGECIDLKLVCNGNADCLDGSDESECNLNTCSDSCRVGNECSHTCNPTPRGPLCSCPAGYRLSPRDSKSCEDIDECSENLCDHHCRNLKGGFKCTCHDEYILKPDHKTCKAKGNPPLFVYEWNQKILIAGQDLLSAAQIDVPSTLSGLDVDSHNGNIYWTDAERGTINRLNTNPKVAPEILITGLLTPSHIAFDWISNNVYVVSSNSSGGKPEVSIWICNLSQNSTKRVCASLYHISEDDATGIAVAPEENYIFWTEISFNYHSFSGFIIRGNMDGTGSTMLATEKVEHPTGIAVDHLFKRVFWIDSKTGTVESVNFDGKERETVISTSTGISQQISSGLAVFEKWIMWIDGDTNFRCRTNMKTECMHVKIQNASNARFLTVLQQAVQPNGKDPCENNSCSFICTSTRPHFTLSSKVKTTRLPKCLCPDGFINDDANQINCSNKRPSTDTSEHSEVSEVRKPTDAVAVDNRSSSGSVSIKAIESGNDSENIPKVVDPFIHDSKSSFNVNGTVESSVLVLFIIVLIVGGVCFFYRNNYRQPKIIVRPYVQQSELSQSNLYLQMLPDNVPDPHEKLQGKVYLH